MEFSVNSPILYIIVGAIISIVLAQSAFFLIRACKRAKELGISNQTIKKTITSSAVFTIAPAVAVLIGVVALSKSLGVALPWLRLSVIGSITYETVAAGNALESAGMSAGTTITDPSIFITIAWVMTVGNYVFTAWNADVMKMSFVASFPADLQYAAPGLPTCNDLKYIAGTITEWNHTALTDNAVTFTAKSPAFL